MDNINWLWQYNKSINVDCQTTPFFLPVRCAASYLKRYIVKVIKNIFMVKTLQQCSQTIS